nr:hypothetical protein [uncultured Celeribacter sp.]
MSSFGFKMRNDDGEVSLDGEYPVMMVAKTGNTALLYDRVSDATPVGYGYRRATYETATLQYPDYKFTNSYTQTALGAFDAFLDPGSQYGCALPNFGAEFTINPSLLFLKTFGRSGICASTNAIFDFENGLKGVMPLVMTDSRNPAPYLYASPAMIGTSGDTYGMLIRDASGTVVYDNRFQAPAIEATILLSNATISDVINNGASVDVSLPVSMPDCWISAPSLNSFKVSWRRAYGDWYVKTSRLRVMQTSSTVINVSRWQKEVNTGLSSAGDNLTFIQDDAMLFVAPDLS